MTTEIRSGRNIKIVTTACGEGASSDATVFFIHGSMARKEQYEYLIEHFESKLNTVAYDYLGCGESDKPQDSIFASESLYSTENILADALAVFKKHATKKNFVIGHSYGTCVVARMIRSLQEEQKDETSPSIDGVCLLGSAETLSASKSLFYLPTFVLELLQPMLSSGFADLAFSPKSDPAVKHKALAYSGQNAMHVCKSFYMNFEWATADDWTALSTLPTLLISGEDDKLTPVEKAQSLFANFLQGKESRATIEVVTCAGHQVMQEQPQKVIEILETFMQPLGIMP